MQSADRPMDALHMPDIASKLLPRPETLVGYGFRCWLSGYQTGNIRNWEECWSFYRKELGNDTARKAVTDLASWVNAVRISTLRDIRLLPARCPSFCRDECLAVSLIAASQHQACPALQACAYALIGADHIETVLKTAGNFAATLKAFDVVLGQDLAGTTLQ